MDQTQVPYRPGLRLDVQRHHVAAEREYDERIASEVYDPGESLLALSVTALMALIVRRRARPSTESLRKAPETT